MVSITDLSFTTDVVQQFVVPTFILDARGHVILWNRACEALTGLAASQVIGTRSHWRAFYEDERPCLADLLVHGRTKDIPHYYPVHRQSPGSAYSFHTENWCVMPLRDHRLYLEIDAAPIHDEHGQLVAVVETMRDTTLRQSAECRLRTLFEYSPDPVWVIENGCFIECNDAAVNALGYRSKERLLNIHPSHVSPPVQPDGEDSFTKAERMMAIAQERGLHRYEWIYTRADGSDFTAEVTLSVIDLAGRKAIYCAWRDIADRKRAEEKLRLYARVFEHSGEAILISDKNNRIISVNQALEQDTGYSRAELMGQDPHMLSAGKTTPETYRQMWAALTDKQTGFWQGELWDLRKDGSTYPKWAAISAIYDPSGALTNYIASYTDISEHKAAEERITRLAHHDALTGLLNRYSLGGRLAQALLTARREKREIAVLFIDLDRFKIINDTLGHHVGDQLLVEVAQRLSSCVRESDIVARFGGDEFVVALTSLSNHLDVVQVANKIITTLEPPCEIGGNQLHITPSVGISLFPSNGEDVGVLIKNADTAMYFAKDKGRNNFQFFSPAMTAVATERLEIERDLRCALKKKEFELHYQPQVCASKGVIHGVEALIRWRHPERGLIPPLKFIPIAEETGVIAAIGGWVIEEACRQMAQWRKSGFDLKQISVNLSAHQLRSQDLVTQVKSAIAHFGLSPNQLVLEITESVAMEDPERAIKHLCALRDCGVELAIDDFGTGYSSLAYLKQLPIQKLKLDKAFVRDIESDINDAAISAAAISLAHILGLKVVAEGVETEAQRYFLSTVHRCDLLQGYLFGKPQPAEVLSAGWHTCDAMPRISMADMSTPIEPGQE